MTSESAPQADFDSLQQAAAWFALLCADQVSEQDRVSWQRWLQQSPIHAAAWRHIEAVSQRFEPLRPGGAQAALAGTGAARKSVLRRRRVLGGGIAAVGTGLLSWLGWRFTPLPDTTRALLADYATGTGERRDLHLADGSRVWLNARSALDVEYQNTMRRLLLQAGEILIETAVDSSQRPFYVDSRFGRMQALGTRFSVRLTDTEAQLDVFDGAVAVTTRSGASVRVAAGGQLRFDADRILQSQAADPARESWSRGLLVANNLPLKDLVAELGRYRRGYLAVAPEIADMAVMGVFPVDDTDRALDMLENNLPIRVQRTLPWWTTVLPRS